MPTWRLTLRRPRPPASHDDQRKHRQRRCRMTTEAQPQPSMLDVLRSTWDTCPIFEQLREHAPILHVPELDAWVLSRYEDVLKVVRDTEGFGAMPADLVGEVPAEV